MHPTEETCASSRRRYGTTRFVTFSCLGRRHWLAHGAARDTVARMIADGARGDDVRLHAWVVMSNHLHFLASDAELPVLSWAASFRKRFALHERKAIAWCLPEEARTGPF